MTVASPRLLLIALATLAGAPSVIVAPGLQPACVACIADYVSGEDAGAYKDIAVVGCSGPCDCSAAGSPCFDPTVGAAMKVGSPENQAACCALCAATTGCVGWVIPSGMAGVSLPADDKPFCWVKHDFSNVDHAPNRAHGKFVPSYSCSAHWGLSFLVWTGMCSALYVGGGSVFGARALGRAPDLRAHPHHALWVDVAGLVSDGVAFARAAAHGRPARETGRKQAVGGSYRPVPDHSRDDGAGGGRKQREAEKSKSKHGHKKGSRKEPSVKSDATSTASGSPSVVDSEAAQSAVRAVAGTAAGDGGRW